MQCFDWLMNLRFGYGSKRRIHLTFKARALFFPMIVVCLVLWVGWGFAQSDGEDKMTASIQIQISSKEEYPWQGFGVSGAWWAQYIGGCSEETIQVIMDILFDKKEGIGLDIYRYNIGAGEGHTISDPWRSTESFEIAPGQYDWNRDASAVRILKESVARGVEHVVTFANSPPAWMTVSGNVDGHPRGRENLSPDKIDDFARYLVDVSVHLKDLGIPVREISPINEPQWDWNPSKGQEGCFYSPELSARVVSSLIGELERRELDLEIAAIDSGDWRRSRRYLDTLMEDDKIAAHLHTFHLHSYWSDSMDKTRLVRYIDQHYPGLKLVMSEWTQMERGRDMGMDSALQMARLIWEDISLGRVISWHYWIGVSKYDFHDGLIYVDLMHDLDPNPVITKTKRLYVMGQYAKYIQPGWLPVTLSGEFSHLKPVAFADPSSSALVIVVLNDSPMSIRTRVQLEDPKGWDLKEAVCTDPLLDLQRLSLPVHGCDEEIDFFPKSVTTLVFERSK